LKKGIIYMIAASLLFAVMNLLVFLTKSWDSEESSLVASFIRVFVNLLIVIVMAKWGWGTRSPPIGVRKLFGDSRWSLWLRGVFGTMSVIAVFYAVHEVGVSTAGFLNASNAIWVGTLGPMILGQKNTRLGWVAIGGGLVGLYFLYQPNFVDEEFYGRTVGLASGLFGACAYLMVSKAGRSNHPLTVVFYFTLVASLTHLAWFAVSAPTWPKSMASFGVLILAGISATFAQVFMTKAYQETPAAIVAAVSYIGPVFAAVMGALFFGDILNLRSYLGALLVIICGVALPYMTLTRKLANKTNLEAKSL
jgi:S-adenosylmethionine uptake transporter